MLSTTIARPYAKAIFELALSEKKLNEWTKYLLVSSELILDEEVMKFITNPASTKNQQVDLVQSILKAELGENKTLYNLIELLAQNKRLALLPEIKEIYDSYKADEEKKLEVQLYSFSDVSTSQQEQLVKSLSKKLQRIVTLKINIDPSLLGGAIIQAGDLVIDGSVRGKLNKLRTGLAA